MAMGTGARPACRRMTARAAWAALAVVVGAAAVWVAVPGSRDATFIVGRSDVVVLPDPTPVPVPVYVPGAPPPDPSRVAAAAVAREPAPAPRRDLHFFLVVGSDARPGEDIASARADSIHVVAVDPFTLRGTVLGIPRDTYVDIPGHGKRKLNAALVLGGPQLLVRTVQELTGLPVSHYALTGFQGLVEMVDELGGVEVYVPHAMNDDLSGARFNEGWHHMNGEDALAFTRCRRGVPGGDFGRSENQGRVIVHALQKARAEIAAEDGIRRWLDVLFRRARLDMPLDEAVRLAAVAHRIAPASLTNLVAPGQSRTVGSQSVVVLEASAYALFAQIRTTAVADGWPAQPVPEPPPPAPPPDPPPEPTPEPGLVPELPVPVPLP